MNQEEQWLLKEKYNGEKSEGFFTDCERLAAGEPLGYVIGHVPFLDCTIHLDNHPLIPRPETEYWTEKAIDEIKKHAQVAKQNDIHILDLCAGSGAIGVAVAKAVPEARVDFAEIDSRLLPTVTKNLEVNNLPYINHKVFTSDLFENVNGKFAYILSNPPYIDPEIDRTEPSVKNHEPHQALYGGHLGLELIEKIITDAPQYLTQGGQLWIEHEPEQSEAIKELGEKNNFSVTTHQDQYGVERYTILVLQ